MAKSQNQKLKLLYLWEYLTQQTSEEHPVSIKQIIAYLESQDIAAERKAIYDDLELLRYWGLDIIQVGESRSTAYYVGSRDFELPELKLMVDSVQSSKFITEKKTIALIKKIEQLTNAFDAQLLSRQVFVANRIKTMNESIFYNVDAIHSAIAANKKLQFHYFEYTVTKERRLRHDGAFYQISPFALTWDDENYYMVGYDSEMARIRHFRVDKMIDISSLDEERDGQDAYAKMDLALYARKTFGMFVGEDKKVTLRFENSLVGPVIDRFGKEIMIIPDGDEHFKFTADVAVSPQFFAWICGFGTQAEIIGPAEVVSEFAKHIRSIADQYPSA